MKNKLHRYYLLSMLVSCVMVACALKLWGDPEVRGNPGEISFLTAFGAVWILAGRFLSEWMGISCGIDVQDGRNPAATVALCSLTIAWGLFYAGGSVGAGDSYLQNVFSAGLAGIGFIAIWIVLELTTRISRAVTEDRDFASGLRLGGFFLGCGLILARAVAGDWESTLGTIQDFFHDGWPAGALAVLAIFIEKLAQPTVQQPMRPILIFGLAPFIVFTGLAAFWIYQLGPWEGMPR